MTDSTTHAHAGAAHATGPLTRAAITMRETDPVLRDLLLSDRQDDDLTRETFAAHGVFVVGGRAFADFMADPGEAVPGVERRDGHLFLNPEPSERFVIADHRDMPEAVSVLCRGYVHLSPAQALLAARELILRAEIALARQEERLSSMWGDR